MVSHWSKDSNEAGPDSTDFTLAALNAPDESEDQEPPNQGSGLMRHQSPLGEEDVNDDVEDEFNHDGSPWTLMREGLWIAAERRRS